MINRVKGTQDILDLSLYSFIYNQAKTYFERYCFTEIELPILEPSELFKRSLGLATDVVSKEMYMVHTGHETSDEDAICLRPEATASTMRAFYNNGVQEQPWKVFTYGSMFRHERPQKGRLRQFHQISLEILGAASISNDAQLIIMLDRFFHEILTLDSYALVLNFLGCFDDRATMKQKLQEFLERHLEVICSTCKERKDKNTLRVFDCKNPTCQELYQQAPKVTDCLCETCTYEWEMLQSMLQQLSVSFTHDPRLVRGLDYYNKTVFEFVSLDLGAQNTFCGGGRYDGLAPMLGAKHELPALGAAFGVERLVIMLEQHKERLMLSPKAPLHVIMPMTHAQHVLALFIADTLHAAKLTCEIMLEDESLKGMMRKANKLGAKFVIIIGSEEQESRQVTLKNMITGDEQKIAQSELVPFLRK